MPLDQIIPKDPPATGVTESQLRADRIQLLYLSSFPAVYMSLAAGSLLAILLWPATAHATILLWLMALGAASAARVGLFLAYRLKSPAGDDLLAWERPYVVTLMTSSLVWGLGGVWIMPKHSLMHQAMTLFVLIGMAGGALAAYSAIRWLVIATIATVLLPATLWLLATGARPAVVMGIGALLFFASTLRATRVLSAALQQNFEMTRALREAKESAERIASTDALTGLANRRSFLERAEAPFQFCARHRLPMAAIVLDLDHFKQINDTRGHAAGDAAIRHAAEVIRTSLRRSDMCCRWGGEEFVIALPGASLEEAAGIAEKLRARMAGETVPGADLSFTASLGVAEGHATLEELVHRADLALYRAKREGRNRVARDDTEAAAAPAAG